MNSDAVEHRSLTFQALLETCEKIREMELPPKVIHYGNPRLLPMKGWHEKRSYRQRVNKKRMKRYDAICPLKRGEYIHLPQQRLIVVHYDSVKRIRDALLQG